LLQVIKLIPESSPFIQRRSSLGTRCNLEDPALCPYSQPAVEPVVFDAALSYDPDGGGLCFRWECVEPASCTTSTSIGARVWQGAGRDKVGFGLYAVRFSEGISDVDICQLHKHPDRPSTPLSGQALGQNGPTVASIDPVECARLLEEYGITETRLRLKVTVVKQAINNGQPTCDLLFPTFYGPAVSQYVDLTVWAESRNHTRTRLQQGWQQPLVTIHPRPRKFDPNQRLKLSCTEPWIAPTPYVPSPPRVSYVWTLLDDKSRALPSLASITQGADLCGIELPEKSLAHGRSYTFQLDAFLPNGMTSRSVVIVDTLPEPLGGELRVHPPSGISIITDFTLSCYYWTSRSIEDLPLRFSFQVSNVVTVVTDGVM